MQATRWLRRREGDGSVVREAREELRRALKDRLARNASEAEVAPFREDLRRMRDCRGAECSR